MSFCTVAQDIGKEKKSWWELKNVITLCIPNKNENKMSNVTRIQTSGTVGKVLKIPKIYRGMKVETSTLVLGGKGVNSDI